MFNEEKSNEFGNIEFKKTSFYPINDEILITPSFALMINAYKEGKNIQEQMDYQDRITTYINLKSEYSLKKQYKDVIEDLYNNGILSINKKEYPLTNFFIVYHDSDKLFSLLNIALKNHIAYDHAIKFIDTTAFINLINHPDVTITDNKVIVKDESIIDNLVNDWNGFVHNEVKETDAIINKRIVGDISE